jgi:predicted 3-demethylubiquinone-9 3-methyltransferase (glyoxalase superfamily)
LVDRGHYLMAPANYGFSQWFCWLQDRWGVSWQFNLP